MKFEWDTKKNANNLQKHGVQFEDAALLFASANLYTYHSKHAGSDKERYVTVGPLKGKLFTVVYTLRADIIRIISLSRARHEEEKHYRALYAR